MPPSRFGRRIRDPDFCERRGYHGPFDRVQEYAQVHGWEGLGECITCGSCRNVAAEEARRRAVRGEHGRSEPRDERP